MVIIYISIDTRCCSLTGAKDMTSVIGTAIFIHYHVVRTDFSIASYGDDTVTTIRIL